MTNDLKVSPTHSGLIIQNSEKEYLLQMRDSGAVWEPLAWAFFGGKINDGETPVTAAVREAAEELELSIDAADLTEAAHFHYEPDGTEIFFYQYAKTVEWGDFRVHEGAGAGFFSFDELGQLRVPPFTRYVVAHYFK